MIRRLTTSLVLGLFLATSALAQQAGDAEAKKEQGQERLEKLKERLKLTPKQTETLKPMIQAEVAELSAIKEKYVSDTSRRGKVSMVREMKPIYERYQRQIQAVLTPEQQTEWKKIKDERKKELKAQRG